MTFLLPFLAACWPALGNLHREAALTPVAALTCAEVAIRAPWHGVPPAVAVRQAWAESRFRRDVVSHRGAVGPLQVIPRYWCANYSKISNSCDTVGAGLRALAYYRRTAGACWRERYTGRKCA